MADATLTYAPVGGLVMAVDNVTLIASIPSQGKLVYIDTMTEKELKQVDVDFQPSLLAIQGKRLFVAAKGAPKIFVLDADSGKVKKEIKLPGESLFSLNCNPTKGLLYAVNLNHEVYSIDVEKETSTKTKAKGQLLTIAPSDGAFVYTGIQKPMNEVLVFEQVGTSTRVSLQQANARALMLKYRVDGADLTLVSVNDNAAVNGRAMAISPDGKQVAMAGGGGWRSKTDPKANYAIAVFDSDKMEGLNGQVDTGPYPTNVAFHPVLGYGVAFNSKELSLFNSKSFVSKQSFKVIDTSFNHSGYLLFGGKGTKIINCSYNAPIKKDSNLQIFALKLSDDEKDQLTKAYAEGQTPKVTSPLKVSPIPPKETVVSPTPTPPNGTTKAEVPAVKPPNGWIQVNNKSTTFSAWFPDEGKIKESIRNGTTKAGPIRMTMAAMERKDGTAYLVAQLNLPPELSKGSPKIRFDSLRDSAAEEFEGKVVDEKNIDMAGLNGREITIQPKNDKLMVRMRIVGPGVQIYRILVIGTKDQINSKDADAFFDCFRRVSRIAPALPPKPVPPMDK